jgi:hypothetical protein
MRIRHKKSTISPLEIGIAIINALCFFRGSSRTVLYICFIALTSVKDDLSCETLGIPLRVNFFWGLSEMLWPYL